MKNQNMFSLNDDFMKKIKRERLNYDNISFFRSKCPLCQSTIEFSEVATKLIELKIGFNIPALDDFGCMICECESCRGHFLIQVMNPDFSNLSRGAVKTEFFFENDARYNEAISSNKMISDKIHTSFNINSTSYKYDFSKHPLYMCRTCSAYLDDMAYSAASSNINIISDKYADYVNLSIAMLRGSDPEYAIFRMRFICTCGQTHVAFFYKNYRQEMSVNLDDLYLCNVLGSCSLSDTIVSGVYSKDNIMAWLYKLLYRWQILFDRIYIISPFIGHQFQSQATLTDQWMNIISRLDRKKSYIVTRYGQKKVFEKAYEGNTGVKYQTLSDLGLGSDLIDDASQKGDFHAKIYCAVRAGGYECLSGSANIVGGPSKEVVHFNEGASHLDFYSRFLNPLGLTMQPENYNQTLVRNHSLLFDENTGFNPTLQSVYTPDYWNLISSDIIPTRR